MPTDKLSDALALAAQSEWDYITKQRWKSMGLAVLRRLAKELGLEKGTYDVRFCAGGEAVAGECILHSEQIYICLTSTYDLEAAGYARRVKGRKDYTGEQNLPIPKNFEGLLRLAQRLRT